MIHDIFIFIGVLFCVVGFFSWMSNLVIVALVEKNKKDFMIHFVFPPIGIYHYYKCRYQYLGY